MTRHDSGDDGALRFRVTDAEAGQRLDKLLVSHAPGLGRKAAARMFAIGSVLVDGRRVAKGWLARSGDEVLARVESEPLVTPDSSTDLVVRHESATCIVVTKPAGQPTVSLQSGERGTLVSALVARYPELAAVGYRPLEPGVIHRLDTQTSGLVLAARTAEAFSILTGSLKAGRLAKRYLAVVDGRGLPESGVIDGPLAPDPRQKRRVQVPDVSAKASAGARPALSKYRVVARSNPWALVELSVSRAYRHQIRAHLAYIGHPIVGDSLYGGPPVAELGERHALHASYVAWSGDDTVDGFAVDDPLPVEMAALAGV